jgi:hypothetical protein
METKDKARPVEVPWMISPSVSDLRLTVQESRDALIIAEVTTLPKGGPSGGELSNQNVELTFRAGQWVRIEPAYSDHEIIPPDRFAWSDLPFFAVESGNLADRLRDFRMLWTKTGICPDPLVYEIQTSTWLEQTGAGRYQCKHYVVKGHDMWIELLAQNFSWRWIEPSSSIAIETSSIVVPS